jgi:hypothetical protein
MTKHYELIDSVPENIYQLQTCVNMAMKKCVVLQVNDAAVSFNYLCTYDLYSPVHNVLDACISITWGSGRGLGPGILEFFGPCEMGMSRYASSRHKIETFRGLFLTFCSRHFRGQKSRRPLEKSRFCAGTI